MLTYVFTTRICIVAYVTESSPRHHVSLSLVAAGSDMMQSSSVDEQEIDSVSNQFAATDSVADSDDDDCDDAQVSSSGT